MKIRMETNLSFILSCPVYFFLIINSIYDLNFFQNEMYQFVVFRYINHTATNQQYVQK